MMGRGSLPPVKNPTSVLGPSALFLRVSGSNPLQLATLLLMIGFKCRHIYEVRIFRFRRTEKMDWIMKGKTGTRTIPPAPQNFWARTAPVSRLPTVCFFFSRINVIFVVCGLLQAPRLFAVAAVADPLAHRRVSRLSKIYTSNQS